MIKKILIVGKNSYIGSHFFSWLSKWPELYEADSITARNNAWEKYDFSKYNALLCLTGIAHESNKRVTKEQYNSINRDLVVNIAKKARLEGVNHFIFMSSMGVYGLDQGVITKTTQPSPKTEYGRSKLEAEQKLKLLNSVDFCISVLRSPLVYGNDCPGNYRRLEQLATWIPLFPDIYNQRSMIHIDNLCECIRLILEDQAGGLFFPQDKNYHSTKDIVQRKANAHKHFIIFTPVFNSIIRWMINRVSIITKVFGSLIYDMELSENLAKYQVFSNDYSKE